ncbi:hypothetical protein SXCC_04016 [Gluconacetobacter sp. SXCC-1]|nr:hypothetical protein SXCC_04016 [Gluconacetobacter sp. SXCC-1]
MSAPSRAVTTRTMPLSCAAGTGVAPHRQKLITTTAGVMAGCRFMLSLYATVRVMLMGER